MRFSRAQLARKYANHSPYFGWAAVLFFGGLVCILMFLPNILLDLRDCPIRGYFHKL